MKQAVGNGTMPDAGMDRQIGFYPRAWRSHLPWFRSPGILNSQRGDLEMASTSGSDPVADMKAQMAEIRKQNAQDSIDSAWENQKSSKVDKWAQALQEAARKG
ncbi:hypothetical protein [Inquilinus limosus]|nr:hypothetical protein [Inquilinus limosus]